MDGIADRSDLNQTQCCIDVRASRGWKIDQVCMSFECIVDCAESVACQCWSVLEMVKPPSHRLHYSGTVDAIHVLTPGSLSAKTGPHDVNGQGPTRMLGGPPADAITLDS